MAQTKLAGAWSYEDILSFPDDDRRYEIIEGDLYEMPSPTSVHAATIINLIALLLPNVPMSPTYKVAYLPHRWTPLFQSGTPFNQIFSWYFQAEKHEWNCAASRVPRTS
jgi:Putative restriction endonuclease